MEASNDGKRCAASRNSNWLDLDKIYEPRFFLFPKSLLSPLLCRTLPAASSVYKVLLKLKKQNTTEALASCTSCQPSEPKVNNVLRCDSARGEKWDRETQRFGCLLCTGVTFRCTNSVLTMTFSFF